MDFENKEHIAVFIERHLKELGGEAYGVPYIAEKLWQWHENQVKNCDLADVGGSCCAKPGKRYGKFEIILADKQGTDVAVEYCEECGHVYSLVEY